MIRIVFLALFFCSMLAGAFCGEDFVVFTQPSTGAHLLVPILQELTGKEGVWPAHYFEQKICGEESFYALAEDPDYVAYLWNRCPTPKAHFQHALKSMKMKKQFMFLHAPFTLNMQSLIEDSNYRVFYLRRDPRDTCISLLQHSLHFENGIIDEPWFRSLGINEQIKVVIEGTEWHNSLRHITREFMPWEGSPVCCTVDFAKLMGPYGGEASAEEHLAELRKIADFLGIAIKDEKLLEIFYKVYATGYTFHRGRVGMWKDFFTKEHKSLFKEELGDLLIEMGFEESSDW
jgi:sulfotransferase 6B1